MQHELGNFKIIYRNIVAAPDRITARDRTVLFKGGWQVKGDSKPIEAAIAFVKSGGVNMIRYRVQEGSNRIILGARATGRSNAGRGDSGGILQGPFGG